MRGHSFHSRVRPGRNAQSLTTYPAQFRLAVNRRAVRELTLDAKLA
jgi:hypothetical protein